MNVLPESFGNLHRLEELELINNNLQSLPDNFDELDDQTSKIFKILKEWIAKIIKSFISGKKNEDSPHSNINVESISFKEYLQTVEQFRVLFGKNVNIELFTKNPYITTAHYDSNKDHCIYCFEVKK